MNWVIDKKIVGYFGTDDNNLYIDGHYDDRPFLNLLKNIQHQSDCDVRTLVFPKQIHTAEIMVIEDETKLEEPFDLFHQKADAIITQKKNIGIGVVTADCLPVFLYDPHNEAIGAIHAGWRGLAAKIISATISKMQQHYQTNPNELHVFLGPSAGICCYEVQDDFLSHFPSTILQDNVIEQREKQYFFSPKKAAVLELLSNQIPFHAIDSSRNSCTICNPTFCSVRRQKENAGRQPSVLLLRE